MTVHLLGWLLLLGEGMGCLERDVESVFRCSRWRILFSKTSTRAVSEAPPVFCLVALGSIVILGY